MQIKQRHAGFTIVELLIVIVVIGILAAITIVAYNGIRHRSNIAKSQSDLKGMQRLLALYHADNGSYPNTYVAGEREWFFTSEQGDGFIPGIVPKYVSALPRPTVGAYMYDSDGTDYKLMRYSLIPSGEWAQIPPDMIDSFGGIYNDRYGYWTAGGAGF
jgi:prepilin-type N-terminal cleavage/methylation domain-containing protein